MLDPQTGSATVPQIPLQPAALDGLTAERRVAASAVHERLERRGDLRCGPSEGRARTDR
jgi:hypothetical protein